MTEKMRQFRDPTLKIFWDNCLWMCLFELGNEPYASREVQHREDLKAILPSFKIGAAGIVFSPCLFADVRKDVRLEAFRAKLQPLEDAGYVTILEPTSDWDGLANLRQAIRNDVRNNPAAFSGINNTNAALGDTAVVYAAIKTGCNELWTYDPLLLALNRRSSVRGLEIVEPHFPPPQGVLDI